MRKLINTLLITLAVSVGGVPIAYAACMDDAGDALAAFFSGGASYAVCQMVETVQSMIRTVQIIVGSMERMTRETIETGQRMVNESADSIINNTNEAMRQLASMKDEANRLANSAAPTQPAVRVQAPANAPRAMAAQASVQAQLPAVQNQQALAIKPGAKVTPSLNTQANTARPMAVTPATASGEPAAAGEVHNAMRQAADTVARMHTTLANQTASHILSAANQAKNQALRHMDAARRIAETSVMAPLRQLEGMLLDLVNHPERIFDPTSLVNESVERLTRAMTEVTELMHHEIMNESLATLRDINGEISRLTGDIGKAERIHNAMVKLDSRRDQQSLNELRTLLGSGGGSPSNLAGLRLAGSLKIMPNLQQSKTSATQQSSRTMMPLIDSLKRDFSTFKNVKLQTSKNTLPASVEQRARAELDRMLKNKSQAEATNIKNQLKNQMRSKMHNNPKALAELDRNFDARFTRMMPPPSPVQPAMKMKPVLVQPMNIQQVN